jgi:chromate transporter
MQNLIALFWSFFKVGSFSFGGAYSLLPLIENEIVVNHSWVTRDEFLKVLGMVEIIPGAISIKYATYTGFKVAGVPGIIAANLGNMIMPIGLIILISSFYFHFEQNKLVMKAFQGVKFVIIGMILAVMIKYLQSQYTMPKEIIFIAIGLVLALFFKFNPIVIISVGVILSLILL